VDFGRRARANSHNVDLRLVGQSNARDAARPVHGEVGKPLAAPTNRLNACSDTFTVRSPRATIPMQPNGGQPAFDLQKGGFNAQVHPCNSFRHICSRGATGSWKSRKAGFVGNGIDRIIQV
jgi:hypothetical protein